MPKFQVFQIGARMHYAVPEILDRHGYLAVLHTDILNRNSRFDPVRALLGSSAAGRRYRGRVVSRTLLDKTIEHRLTAMWYLMRLHSRTSRQARLHVLAEQAKALTSIVARTGFQGADSVYCHTTSGLELLRAAKSKGIRSYLEQNNAAQPFGDRILTAVRRNNVGWGLPGECSFAGELMYDRVREEWELADTIVCPSQFVADSLISEGVDPKKLEIVPYGVATPAEVAVNVARRNDCPLRLLFVGTVEVRKGVHTIYEAFRSIPEGVAEIRFVGPVRLSDAGAARLSDVGELLGQVPRVEVARWFEWADVLVLPSFVEGSATVTYEALSRGMPVICTPNTGSIVENGQTGLLVEPGQPRALAEAILRLAEDRSYLCRMQEMAATRRHQTSLDEYEGNLRRVLAERDAPRVS